MIIENFHNSRLTYGYFDCDKYPNKFYRFQDNKFGYASYSAVTVGHISHSLINFVPEFFTVGHDLEHDLYSFGFYDLIVSKIKSNNMEVRGYDYVNNPRDIVGKYFVGFPYDGNYGNRLFSSFDFNDCIEFVFNKMCDAQNYYGNADLKYISICRGVSELMYKPNYYYTVLYYDTFTIKGVNLLPYLPCCENLDFLPIVNILGG